MLHVDGTTEAAGVEDLQGFYVLDAVWILGVLSLGASHDQEVFHDLNLGFKHVWICSLLNLIDQDHLLNVGVGTNFFWIHLR
jgi:hypothetical protein